MNWRRLNIGAYFLQEYACTDRHVRELRECGVDFIVGMQNNPGHLDLLHKYNVGAVLGGVVPGWWGGDGSSAGTMAAERPLSVYDRAAAEFSDHPAVWGIDAGDEPSAEDFPHYGKIVRRIDEAFPNQFAYANLYPCYGSVAWSSEQQMLAELGAADYPEYIRRYCECVQTDYICFDFYVYSSTVARMYESLEAVSAACRRTGRSLWTVLQVNSHVPETFQSENRLRFQAFTAMAFGAENIIWACYTAGWWHNQVLDEHGEKTEQYDKLKKVNSEIREIADVYMDYRCTDTAFLGFAERSADLSRTQMRGSDVLNFGAFSGLHSDRPLAAGMMTAREGTGSALMLCAAGDPMDKAPGVCTVSFRAESARLIGAGELVQTAPGEYRLTLPDNAGALITAE